MNSRKQKSGSGKAKPPAKVSSFPSRFLENNGKKRVLHVGCGAPNPLKLNERFRTPEWEEIRLDINPAVTPDVVSDMRSMPMVPDSSVDAIWSSHNVEHLYPHDVNKALTEFFRVTKMGGFALISLPDLQTIAEHIAAGRADEPLYQSPAGPIYAIDMLYGFRKSMERGNLFMAHKNAFTAPMLGRALREAGYCNIRIQRTVMDLWAFGYKLPANHEQRTDRIMVLDDRLGPTGLTDELDRPPVLWKPLNLKRSS